MLRCNAVGVLVTMGVRRGRYFGNSGCTHRDTFTRIRCARGSMSAHLSGGADGGSLLTSEGGRGGSHPSPANFPG